ncbi:DTMP kinase [Aphelenchoides bicaudatus]|nr:DTMP kinase [Aphelenchoides bicaudatus]
MVASRGLFIVFEGLDRSGKSTQCKLLLDFLQKCCSARIQRYPGKSEPTTGPKLDQFLKTAKSPYENAEEIHCLFAENRRVIDPHLRESILSGETVIADRYSFSGIAYTAAKDVSLDFACKTELGLLKPDLVIYLNADPQATSNRAGFGDEALERADFQLKVYKQMKRLINHNFWVEVDALRSIEDVHNSIKSVVTELMSKSPPQLTSFELSDFNMN